MRLLLENGDRVVVFDSVPDQRQLELVLGKPGTRDIAVIPGDITDFEQLTRSCEEHRVERMIHTAAILTSENPLLTVQVNCDGTINVLEAARRLSMEKVVLTSSIAVFGPPEKYKEEYIPNDAPHFPMSIYGATKSFNEACARFYFSEHCLDVLAIRLPNVFGLGRKTTGVGWRIFEEMFIKPIVMGKPGRVPFGDAFHNCLHVEDAARLLVKASQAGKTNTRAFTAGGEIRSTAELADYIKRMVPGADITLLPGSFSYPCKFETTPLKEELDYQPRWTIEQTLNMIIDQLQRKKS